MGLEIALNEGENLVIVDSIANQHGYITPVRQGNRWMLNVEFPTSIGVIREEKLEKGVLAEYLDLRKNDPFIGQIVSGTVSGTSDVIKRGLAVTMLGSMMPEMESPLRILIKTPELSWYVLNSHPADIISPHLYSRAEAAMRKAFKKVNIKDMCDEVFGVVV